MNTAVHKGVFFRMNPEQSARIKAWVEEIDWQVIRATIEKRGRALVIDQFSSPGPGFFQTIDSVPAERGRYRLHMGSFGGGFEYRFRAKSGFAALTAISTAQIAADLGLQTLQLNLPDSLAWQFSGETFGIPYVHDSYFEAGHEHWFGVCAEFFDMFRRWKWYSEDVENFEFQFYPMSVGCMARIIHIESGEILDLTQDVEW